MLKKDWKPNAFVAKITKSNLALNVYSVKEIQWNTKCFAINYHEIDFAHGSARIEKPIL